MTVDGDLGETPACPRCGKPARPGGPGDVAFTRVSALGPPRQVVPDLVCTDDSCRASFFHDGRVLGLLLRSQPTRVREQEVHLGSKSAWDVAAMTGDGHVMLSYGSAYTDYKLQVDREAVPALAAALALRTGWRPGPGDDPLRGGDARTVLGLVRVVVEDASMETMDDFARFLEASGIPFRRDHYSSGY